MAKVKNITDNDIRKSQLHNLVSNILRSRAKLLGDLLDGKRDINKACNYPDIISDPFQFQRFYDREAIANRVVEVYPSESWQVTPDIYEDSDSDTSTDFESAWIDMSKNLQGIESFLESELNPIWEYLLRADILSGIGSYGVIILDIDDGKDWSEPADISTSGIANRKLKSIRVFPESQAQITQFENDINSPRYSFPYMYLITMNEVGRTYTGIGMPLASFNVHWTRVIHIADNLLSSEYLGMPRMLPVMNRLIDLRKLYGGSAEMYWQGAFPGISFESQPQLGGDVDLDLDTIKSNLDDYINDLQRYLVSTGMSAKSLAPQVVDPTSQIQVHLEAICIKLGIPKRIFMGSERGELASTQDDDAWNDRLKKRQSRYITPRIIAPFVDRLIWLGVLPRPKKYLVKWPDLTSQSDAQKSQIATQRTSAMVQYSSSNLPDYITPLDFYVHIMQLEEDVALSIMENVEIQISQGIDDNHDVDTNIDTKTNTDTDDKTRVETDISTDKKDKNSVSVENQTTNMTPIATSGGTTDQPRDELGQFAKTDSSGSQKQDDKKEDKKDKKDKDSSKSTKDKVKEVLDKAGTDANVGYLMTKEVAGKVAVGVVKGTMTAINAVPMFAKEVVKETGVSENVAKIAGIAATIGDWAAPGVPAGSLAVIALASVKKPTAVYTASKRLIKEFQEKRKSKKESTENQKEIDMKQIENVQNLVNNKEVADKIEKSLKEEKTKKTTIEIAERAKKKGKDEETQGQWISAYIIAIENGENHNEAMDFADMFIDKIKEDPDFLNIDMTSDELKEIKEIQELEKETEESEKDE